MTKRIKEKNIGKNKKITINHLETFDPLTETQALVKEAYKDSKSLVLHGIAGTGKSFLSIGLALEEILQPNNEYEKLVIVRSVVPTRDIGFLKGTDEEKIAVYEAPYHAICEELFSVENAYETLKNQGCIEFISTSFIRGLTFNNAIVLVDEFENLNFHELDSVITRIGKDCKVIFCGDYTQSDFTKTNERNGCLSFMKILKNMRNFASIEFSVEDIVRSDLVKEYIINKYKLGLNNGV